MHRPMMFDESDNKLDNPRNVLWKFLFSYLKPHRGSFILFIVLLLIGTSIMSLSPLISASIIDYGIIAQNAQYILSMATLYLFMMIFMAVSNYISQYGMGKVSQNVVFGIRNDLFLLSLVLTILFMYILNPLLATISLAVFPLFLLMMRFFKNTITGVFKKTRESISTVTSSIQENIAGAKVVQSYGQEKKATSEFDKANTENYQIMLKVRRIMSVFFPLVTLEVFRF